MENINSISTVPRCPERSDLYNDADEVGAYSQATRRLVFRLLEKSFASWIVDELGGGSDLRIADLGTGPGRVPALLARMRPAWKITGVDRSPLMLAEAARSTRDFAGRMTWVQATVEQTGLPEGRYDAVICHLAFHEFPDPAAVLGEAARLVRPGGRILVQDLRRPFLPSYYFVQMTSRLYYLGSPRMRRQTLASLSASYSAREMEGLLRATRLAGNVQSGWIMGLPTLRVSLVR